MHVAVHAFDGITMFHLAAPLVVFGEVERQGLATGWTQTVWTDDGKGIRTAEGLRVEDVEGPETLESADLVIMPSWPTHLPATTDALGTSLRNAHQRGTHVAGLCLAPSP